MTPKKTIVREEKLQQSRTCLWESRLEEGGRCPRILVQVRLNNISLSVGVFLVKVYLTFVSQNYPWNHYRTGKYTSLLYQSNAEVSLLCHNSPVEDQSEFTQS